MRLMDADEVITVTIWNDEYEEFQEIETTIAQFLINSSDDEIKVVEAIPIEWIENKIKELEHELHEYIVNNLGWSIGFDNYKKYDLCESLKVVLKNWREEK